jgi:hypothetical protein
MVLTSVYQILKKKEEQISILGGDRVRESIPTRRGAAVSKKTTTAGRCSKRPAAAKEEDTMK